MRPHEQTDSDWLDELKEYLARHGRMPRLRTHPRATAQDIRLNSWLNRILYKDIDRTPEKTRVRNEVLDIKASRDRWTAQFEELRAFADTHGRLPVRGENLPVGHWLADQRSAFRRGVLPRERAEKLRTITDALPPAKLTREQELDAAWQGFCAEFAAWLKDKGALPRRRSTDPEEYRLANWHNRQLANHRAGKLSAGYAVKLRSLGAL